jgi:hypothetical protein
VNAVYYFTIIVYILCYYKYLLMPRSFPIQDVKEKKRQVHLVGVIFFWWDFRERGILGRKRRKIVAHMIQVVFLLLYRSSHMYIRYVHVELYEQQCGYISLPQTSAIRSFFSQAFGNVNYYSK